MHGSVIVPDWHETVEGKEYLACILRKNRRREFGLLERPVLPPSVVIDTASYKIFVSGKSGVGKTALVAKLAGLEVPVVHHETTGPLRSPYTSIKTIFSWRGPTLPALPRTAEGDFISRV